MALTLILVSFGAGLGGLASGSMAWYLVITRSYRRVRNPLAIGFGYIFSMGSSVGSLLLMIEGLEWLGVPRHSSQRDATVYAYAVGLACGVFIAVRGEARWRRSVGLDDKSLMLKEQKKS
jgi:hypothetical protein